MYYQRNSKLEQLDSYQSNKNVFYQVVLGSLFWVSLYYFAWLSLVVGDCGRLHYLVMPILQHIWLIDPIPSEMWVYRNSMPEELFQLLHWNQSGVSARILPGLLEFQWNFNRLHKSTGIYNPREKSSTPGKTQEVKWQGGLTWGSNPKPKNKP